MNWHFNHHQSMSFGDEVADWISEHAGSWWSVRLHTCWFLLWFDLNLDVSLLTLIVSLEAIYLCVFLLMSGNRQGERDRHQAWADYQTNPKVKAKIELVRHHLHRLEDKKLDAILKILVDPAIKARARAKHGKRE